MNKAAIQGVALVIVAFVLYYLLTAPVAAANVVTDAGSAVLAAFGQVGIFVDSLFS